MEFKFCETMYIVAERLVRLLLSTPGGQVMAGITGYNFLRALPFRLVIHNAGNIDSIRNAIFLAGPIR